LRSTGNGALATRELGEFQMNWWVNRIVEVIRAVKADEMSLKLQNEFFEQAKHPLDTKQ
jgi:creatinine amidohydrolase